MMKEKQMTKGEAIEILRDTPIDIRSTREDDIHTLYATAQNMAIEALSTEAEPVIHGWWIIEPGIGLKCSNCDFDIGNDLEIEYANYCPYCGAKMDKE